MRIVVAGSRGMPGALAWITRAFQACGWTPTAIISGGGGAVDEASQVYAEQNEIPFTLYLAEWGSKDHTAGFERNREMAKDGAALLAIWDGESNGTKHMIACMKKLRKPVFVAEVTVKFWGIDP